MFRSRLFVALVVVLASCCASAAYAGEESPLLYQWSSGDFAPPGEGEQHYVYMKHNLDFIGETPYDWDREIGASEAYEQRGICTVDPVVNQTMRNLSQYSWTDWHVSITNGYIHLLSADVYNVQVPDPHWVVEYEGIYDGDKATGFLAHVILGEDTQVDPFEHLLVNFTYEALDPEVQVSIDMYPTKDWVPEPGSMAALFAGLAGLGLTVIRRRAR